MKKSSDFILELRRRMFLAQDFQNALDQFVGQKLSGDLVFKIARVLSMKIDEWIKKGLLAAGESTDDIN